MAFKRKFWKRGDRLNAKELNRIEEGICEAKNNTEESGAGTPGIEIIPLNCRYDSEDSLLITDINLTMKEFDRIYNSQSLNIFALHDVDAGVVWHSSFIVKSENEQYEQKIMEAYQVNIDGIYFISIIKDSSSISWRTYSKIDPGEVFTYFDHSSSSESSP